MKVGTWENRMGYDCPQHHNERYLWIFSKPIFEFTLDSTAPLTWVWLEPIVLNGLRLPAMTRMQPEQHFFTDKGSTPKSCQLLFDRATYERCYIFHDSCYRHHGLFVRRPTDEDYWFVRLTRADADRILRLMIGADGGSKAGRAIIWCAVRLFGRWSW